MRRIILNESQLEQLIETIDEMEAYHGGPHKFDKFSTSFAHSGEGANSQGFGVYVTLDKDTTAYHYATYEQQTELRHNTIFVNGVPMKGSMEGGYVGHFREDYPNREGYNEYNGIKLTQYEQEVLFHYIVLYCQNNSDCSVKVSDISEFIQGKLSEADELKKSILSMGTDSKFFNEKTIEDIINMSLFEKGGSYKSCLTVQNILNKFNSNDVLEIPSDKHFEQYIYQLNIPDVNDENYFNWDGNISGQINWNDKYIQSYNNYINQHGEYSSEKNYGNFNHVEKPNAFENLYIYLAEQIFKSEEKTSEYFYNHGKVGHYYQSQFNNINAVIYNADDVKIVNVERI